jgi:geranylgeranyl pyrophosphate synthase
MRISELFRELGSVDYAQHRALQFVDQAKDAISVLKESDAKELLFQTD